MRSPFLSYALSLCLGFVVVCGSSALAADPTMFDEGRAEAALAAIAAKVGHPLRVGDLHITADTFELKIASDDKPGQMEVWEVSQNSLAGALGVDLAKLTYTGDAQFTNKIKDAVFDVNADMMRMIPKMAAAAIAKARLNPAGAVTQMELQRLPTIFTTTVKDPYWLVHVKGVEEYADISFHLDGTISTADLRYTNREANLDLLAGGPDFDDMVKDIRDQIKNDWIFHYIEIGKSSIDFDVHLLSVKNARITRFRATLAGVRTDNLSMPHRVFPGEPEDDPFNLADVDLTRLKTIEQAAIDKLGIPDGLVQRVFVSKPHRENGGAIQWTVDVKSASAPRFVMPGQPRAPEGSVSFDAKGAILYAKYPEGMGPKIHLLEAADLQKALDKIAERLGPHAQMSEIRVGDEHLSVIAADAKNPNLLVAFEYQDADIARASSTSQTVANAMPHEAASLWDLSLLKPATVRMVDAMRKRAVETAKISNGVADRIIFSKDRTFHPGNNQLFVEIGVSDGANANENVEFDLSGAPFKSTPLKSGIFVNGKPASFQSSAADERDCTQSTDPKVVIPACDRMIPASEGDTPHNRAVLFYDRGNAYKDTKRFDQALADYSKAIEIQPDYGHAYLNRAFVHANLNQAKEAAADAGKSIELDPKERRGFVIRGYSYRALGRNDDAIADFTSALALDADDSKLLFDRGVAYYTKGDLDRAIADFSDCAKRDPRNADAFVYRGMSERAKGDFPKAIADHGQAIAISGKSASAYFNRAIEYYVTGALPKALADATQANDLVPSEGYVALLQDVIAVRNGLPSRLKETSAKVDMSAWPAPVARMLMGQLTSEALFEAADSANAATKNSHLCEAHFYSGIAFARGGRKDDATKEFTTASATCPTHALEKMYAEAELKAMAKP